MDIDGSFIEAYAGVLFASKKWSRLIIIQNSINLGAIQMVLRILYPFLDKVFFGLLEADRTAKLFQIEFFGQDVGT